MMTGPQEGSVRRTLIATLTAVSGFVTLASVLGALVHHPRHPILVIADTRFTVIAGLSLIYLGSLLRRGKYNAWLVALPVYAFLLVRNFQHFIIDFRIEDEKIAPAILNLSIPAAGLILLILSRRYFNVRSEVRSFTIAIRRSALVLLVAFLYGIGGMTFLDQRDFHQQVSLPAAAHYTVDQFGLTTDKQLTPQSRRAQVFLDSLGAVSLVSVLYVAVSLFAPIRFRLSHGQRDSFDMRKLLEKHATTSEDYFKLWPPDKTYFFNSDRSAGLAYRTTRGVALVVGDPVGTLREIENLVKQFDAYCYVNDWDIAFVHTDERLLKLYTKLGFEAQKIGEEAIVNLPHFIDNVAGNKYFRHINNRFAKLGYSCEMLKPPHSPELTARLKAISSDWLSIPGREERTFMMGVFNEAYLQQCELFVARDEKGKVVAFLNRVESPVAGEANFDFLRHAKDSPGNINDYLMVNFIQHLSEQTIQRLNMGLSPLTGLEPERQADRSAIDKILHFVYDNADRFYSFQGLARFKSKYEPEWESRYIIYRRGPIGFTKAMTALLKAMTP